jgi:hypothetical protein
MVGEITFCISDNIGKVKSITANVHTPRYNPLSSVVVAPIDGHTPNDKTKSGFSKRIPRRNSSAMFMEAPL